MVEAAASMSESTSEAMTLKEPVISQAASFAQISSRATATEPYVALLSNFAFGTWNDFIAACCVMKKAASLQSSYAA